MADGDFGKIDAKEFTRLQGELKSFSEGMKSASAEFNRLVQGSDLSFLTTSVGKAANAAQDLAKANQEDLMTQRGRNALLKRANEIKREQASIEADILIIKKKIELAEKDELDFLSESLKKAVDLSNQLQGAAENAETLAGAVENVSKAGEGFQKMADFLTGIPLVGRNLGVITSQFTAAAQAAQTATAKGLTPGEARLKGWLTLSKGIAAVFVTSIVAALVSASSRLGEINKQLGLGMDSARATAERFETYARNADDTRITTDKLVKANSDLNKALGTSVEFSGQTLENFIKSTEYMGISIEAFAKLNTLSATTGGNTEDFAGNLALSVAQAGKANGLFMSTTTALEKVKDLSATTLLNLRRNPEAIGEAIIATEKLGISFNQLRGIASSLLDFESSIQNELEAELLTGREINLERARAAALKGDDLALTKELANQVGTLAEYEQMNVIQRESLAKAFGLNSDAMSEMLLKQELLNTLGEEAKNLSAEQARNIRAMVDSGEAKNERDALLRLQQEQDVTKRFQDILLKLKSTFVDIVQKYEKPIAEFVGKIEEFFQSGQFANLITTIKDIIASAIDVIKPIASALSSTGGMAAMLGLLALNKLRGATPFTPLFVTNTGVPGAGGAPGAGGGFMGNFYRKGSAGKFYKGGQFLPGGGQAPKGGTTIGATRGGLTMAGGMGLASIGMIAGGMMQNSENEAISTAGSALSMAGTGAMIGSMIAPGIGTAIGAALGGIGGIFMAQAAKEEEREQKKAELEERRRNAQAELEAAQRDAYSSMESHLKALAERETKIYMDGNDVAISTAMASPKLGN